MTERTDILTRLDQRREMINRGHGNVEDIKDEDCADAAAEIRKLRAVIEDAGYYASLCPPPPEATGVLRIELLECRARIAQAALGESAKEGK